MSLNTAPRAASPKKTIVDLTHGTHSYLISIYFSEHKTYFTFSYTTVTSSILPPRLKGVQCSTTECLPQQARRRQSRRSRGGSVHPNRRLKATNRWEESRGKHHQRTSTLFLTSSYRTTFVAVVGVINSTTACACTFLSIP